ncbi:MAG: hypothetical protein MI702_06235 [Chlorobiales bacterium]|nr:hypothetical protein [Chlorobiales bacterium]
MEAVLAIRSLYFSCFAILFTLSACMVNYLYSRKTFPGFKAWTVGSGLSALAFLLIGLRHMLPDFISIIVSNTLGITAMFFFYIGFKNFAEEKLNYHLHLSFIIIYSVVLFPIFTYISPSLKARVVIASIATAGYALICGLVHYRQGRRGLIDLNIMLILTLFLLIALRTFRAVYYSISSNDITDLMASGDLSGLLILILTILSSSFLICLMQLNSQRLEAENASLIDNLQIALKEIKTLKGILPICSHCKKIRDDKGYWNQIESYIKKHSEAEFSHGICQECAKRFYPDLDIYE